jgi:hypothetical protein
MEEKMKNKTRKTVINAIHQYGMAGIGLSMLIGSLICRSYDLKSKRDYIPHAQKVISIQTGSAFKGNLVKYNDYQPFGSLDEVVTKENGKVVILTPSDSAFGEYQIQWKNGTHNHPYR